MKGVVGRGKLQREGRDGPGEEALQPPSAFALG